MEERTTIYGRVDYSASEQEKSSQPANDQRSAGTKMKDNESRSVKTLMVCRKMGVHSFIVSED